MFFFGISIPPEKSEKSAPQKRVKPKPPGRPRFGDKNFTVGAWDVNRFSLDKLAFVDGIWGDETLLKLCGKYSKPL